MWIFKSAKTGKLEDLKASTMLNFNILSILLWLKNSYTVAQWASIKARLFKGRERRLLISWANQSKGRLTTANLWCTYVTEKEVMWEKSRLCEWKAREKRRLSGRKVCPHLVSAVVSTLLAMDKRTRVPCPNSVVFKQLSKIKQDTWNDVYFKSYYSFKQLAN